MTTSEGGMIISNNKKLIESLKKIRAFGIDRDYSKRKIPGFYDSISLGFNYRMSEINAAIGIQQENSLPGGTPLYVATNGMFDLLWSNPFVLSSCVGN